ncbi:hypothetical protein BGZ88_011357 [Linnemannia elongata]|nr:hypothetical protein BGZ88_011357 [Linnemannia elongata]
MKPSIVLLLQLGQALALLTTAYARLDFAIPKELFIGSDHTVEWVGRPSLGTSQQKVVLFKNDEPILTLCEGLISGSGQCSFRLEEKDVNTIDRGNYAYYIGLQALDGLSLDRTRDFTIQYKEDPAEESLRNGDIGGDGDDESERGDEEDKESREVKHHRKDRGEKKDRDIKKNMKEDKRKANAEDEDDDGDDDDDDDDDDGDDGDEDNKDNDEDDDNESDSDSDEEFDIDMYMDMDVRDTDEAAWYQPVVAFGLPYPEVPTTDSHNKLVMDRQTTTGTRGLDAVSSGSQRPQPAIQHAPVQGKAGPSTANAGSAAKNLVSQFNSVPQ